MTTARWQLPPQTIPDVDGAVHSLPLESAQVLVGRNARAAISGAGTAALFLNDKPVVHNLAVENERTIGLSRNALFLERSLSGGLSERMFVPLKHAGGAWTWHASDATALAVRWALNGQNERFEQHGNALQSGNLVCVCDREVSWESVGGWVRLRTQLNAGDTCTLVIADCANEDCQVLRAFGNLRTLVLSRAADFQRAREELLQVSCSNADWADHLNSAVYALYSAGVSSDALSADLQEPASTLSRFLRDTLGFVADPEKHRVVLAPRVPAAWTALRVRNLVIGNDKISLSYDRSAATHTFVLSPESGAVPARLVFEPSIPAEQISSVTVDGVQAELDLRREQERIVCPLQIVLDHPRTITIVTGGAVP